VSSAFDGIVDRFTAASGAFGEKLGTVRTEQLTWGTPCTEWDVRQLVNHMTRGNLSYIRLLEGATSAEFLRMRDADALGDDPAGAYARSVRKCAAAFTRPAAASTTPFCRIWWHGSATTSATGASRQERLLIQMGRRP